MKALRDALLLFLLLSTLSTSLFLLYASRTIKPQSHFTQTCSLVAASIVCCCCLFLFIVTFSFKATEFQAWVETREEALPARSPRGKRSPRSGGKKISPRQIKRKGPSGKKDLVIARVSVSDGHPLSAASAPAPPSFLVSPPTPRHAPSSALSASLGSYASSPATILTSSLDLFPSSPEIASSPPFSPTISPTSTPSPIISPTTSPSLTSTSPLAIPTTFSPRGSPLSESPPVPKSVMNNVVKALSASSEPEGFRSCRYRSGTHDKFEKKFGSPPMMQLQSSCES